MGKLKKVFSNISQSSKETFKKFPITLIIIWFLTIIFTLNIDREFLNYKLFAHMIFIGSIWAVGTILVEALFENKKSWKSIIGYSITLFIAIIFDRLWENVIDYENVLARWNIAYVAVMLILTIYVLIKKSGLKFEEYNSKLFLNFQRATTVYLIFLIGIVILTSIFIALILDGDGWSLLRRLIILLTGLYYIPSCIHSFVNKDCEDTKFNRGLILYVLLPLVIIAIAIIYLYIFKIFVNSEMPENIIFRILSFIFVVAIPVYINALNYKDKNKFTEKVVKIIPYLYIPFIFLEIYSMKIRTDMYGLTTARYLAYVFVLIQIVIIALLLIRKGKYSKEILPFLGVITIVLCITPLNFETVPYISQKKILDEYVENGIYFDDLSDEEKRRYAGAYQYLEYDGEKYINEELTLIEEEKLSSYSNYWYSWDYDEEEEYGRIYVYEDIDGLNISEYSRIYELITVYNSYENSSRKYSKYEIYANNGEIRTTVNLTEFVEKLINANEISEATMERIFKQNSIIKTNDRNIDIFVNYVNINYDKETLEVESISINGYVLEK